MNKQKKYFSIFKLFYDEFIYKENGNINYINVVNNISKIREFTMDIRKMSKMDIELYQNKLEEINKKIKKQLDEIYRLNKYLFEYFYLIYKGCNELCNDKVEDMPFLISCSFYEDYRLDNKSVEELESSSFVVPRYSSLEKKEIRKEARKVSRFEYFVKLLNNCDDKSRYNEFLDNTKYIMSIKPLLSETHSMYFMRINDVIKDYGKVCSDIEKIARQSDDYLNISELMAIAYKKKFLNWNEALNDMVLEYFDDCYNKMMNTSKVMGSINLVNDISYETYIDLIADLKSEKQKYSSLFKNNKFESVKYIDGSYFSSFKEMLINSYFDKRYNNILEDDSVSCYVSRATDLFELANDLENQIFEKILFDASHSVSLRRNNDVNSAIIAIIYDLYNPYNLIDLFESTCKEFDRKIKSHDKFFIKEFEVSFNAQKKRYSYHGPMPRKNVINTRIIERRKKFILDNCVSELISRDTSGKYDTRNYDLDIIIDDIEIVDVIDLYKKMKEIIKNFNFDSSVGYYALDVYLASAQEFICKSIYRKLKLNLNDKDEVDRKYVDICFNLLKEKCLFIDGVECKNDNEQIYDDFVSKREKFVTNSKWNNFLIRNKI